MFARFITGLLLIVHVSAVAVAQNAADAGADSLAVVTHKNIVERIIDYFDDSNEEHTDRKFDVTFAGGPSYSASTSVQLAAIAAGEYHTRRDSLTSPSNVSLIAQGSVTGFYRFGIRGVHFSPSDRFRIDYGADFSHFPLYFWGIGYPSEVNDANRSKFTQLTTTAHAEVMWQLAPRMFLGPTFHFNYSKATKVERRNLWNGQALDVFAYGMGLAFEYDTRNSTTAPSRGMRLLVCERAYPRFLVNKYPFTLSELTLSGYHRFWKSGVIAAQLHGAFTTGNPPWSLMPMLDQSGAVRSYYEGRYRNRHTIDVVVELRQHVWHRNSLVVWTGAGWVFDHIRQVNLHNILPTVGVGYRWELKKDMNVRVDFGFGRNSTSFTMGLNESF